MPDIAGDWYQCAIERTELKGLMQRRDRDGLVQFGTFMALVIASGCLAWLSLGTAWAIPAFLLYGAIFAFADPGRTNSTTARPSASAGSTRPPTGWSAS